MTSLADTNRGARIHQDDSIQIALSPTFGARSPGFAWSFSSSFILLDAFVGDRLVETFYNRNDSPASRSGSLSSTASNSEESNLLSKADQHALADLSVDECDRK